MRKIILYVLTGLMLSACGSIRNERVPVTGERFAEIVRQHDLETQQLRGNKDVAMGVVAKYRVEFAAESNTDIMFFVFVDEARAKEGFNVCRRDIARTLSSPIEYGSPNDSGVFGNTQEYFAMTIQGVQANVVRVANTVAFSYAPDFEAGKTADSIFEAMGYKDKKEAE